LSQEFRVALNCDIPYRIRNLSEKEKIMRRFSVVYYLLCFALLFALLGGLAGSPALATQESSNDSFSLSLNQEQPPTGEKLEISCKYPVVSKRSGESFEWEVSLDWQGNEFRSFDLRATAPSGWDASIWAGYPEREIPAIGLEPEAKYPEKIKVKLEPPLRELPEPGDYPVTLEASSGDIKETIELKAVVSALYRYYFYTTTGRLNIEVTAGEENHLSCYVENTGTEAIKNVGFMSTKPTGWEVTFNPYSFESLEVGVAQGVDVIITPPSKTVPGDYMVTLKTVSTDYAAREMDIRVTVLTSTVWGWVGILIVLAVIAGLAVMFRRLGRR